MLIPCAFEFSRLPSTALAHPSLSPVASFFFFRLRLPPPPTGSSGFPRFPLNGILPVGGTLPRKFFGRTACAESSTKPTSALSRI